MASTADVRWMEQAIELAAGGRFGASPNPLVGAVILNADGHKVGEGFHRAFGRAHAEVVALNEAGDQAHDGTLFVTLEPCSHHGKTPPCVDAILRAGLKRVVVAVRDPNPVAAGGIVRLEESGVDVDVGVCNEHARVINRRWLTFVDRRTPWVTMKVASSLDGHIATRTGESKWITGGEARRHGRSLRENHEAILVGVGTVVADDPQLTRRLGLNPDPRLRRFILDSTLRTPESSRIITEDPDLTTLVHAAEAPAGRQRFFAESGVNLWEIGTDQAGRLDLAELMQRLGGDNVSALLVEGGGTVHGSFNDHALVDEIHAYIAPMIIGGRAPAAVGGLGVAGLDMAPRFQFEEIQHLGDDMLLRAVRREHLDVHRAD